MKTCRYCEGKGIYPAADGPDDFEMVPCHCGAVALNKLDFVKRCEALSGNVLVV